MASNTSGSGERAPRRRGRRRAFMMAELVFAVVALVLVANAAVASFGALRRAQRRATVDSRALLLLGNVVERLAVERAPPPARVRQLAEEELAAATFPGRGDCIVVCEPAGAHLRLAILHEGRRPAAELRLPLWPAATP